MTITGKVQRLWTGPRGQIEGVLFESGESARAGRKAHLDALGIKAGDTIAVTGRGGTYPHGTALHIESIKLPGGDVRVVEAPPPVRSAVTREGAIAVVLLNPHGDVDGLVLADQTLVRVRPMASSALLVVGAKVRAEGLGTSSFVHADKLVLIATGAVLDLSAPPPGPPSPRDLSELEVASSVRQLVKNAEGDVDALVLEDGSIVRLPHGLRDDLGNAIKVGAKISVRGEGGTYAGVKALRAQRVDLGSGKIFSEPEPPSHPPPPRGVAP